MKASRVRAFILVDLGFGDSGKGLLTDFLVRRTGSTLVVRYNGGAQAGHTVVTADGRQHTFAQFGAGSFVPGVRTFLSRHVVIHPAALLLEAAALRGKQVDDVFSRLRISETARVITPFHQAANRLREIARGEARHGSCGVGVGETVQDALERPVDAINAGDLRDPALCRRKLLRIWERKRAQMRTLLGSGRGAPRVERELSVFERAELVDLWLEEARSIAGLVVADSALATWMRGLDSVVFEGAQGVLLDEWRGFHPFTTWSCCTAENALQLIRESASEAEVVRIGVLRSHAIRHGPGPLPTETEILQPVVSDHNRANEWQGRVRYGWFDAVLSRYALEVVGGVDALAITHLDVVHKLPNCKLSVAYQPLPSADRDLIAPRSENGPLTELPVSAERSIQHQARLSSLLSRVTPFLESTEPSAQMAVAKIERLLGRSVDLVSHGPRASDVSFRRGVPDLRARSFTGGARMGSMAPCP